MENKSNIVAYYRLSCHSVREKDAKVNQLRELDIDAQQQIVRHYYKDGLVKEFKEIKSAKNITDRPVLQEAIAYCLKKQLHSGGRKAR